MHKLNSKIITALVSIGLPLLGSSVAYAAPVLNGHYADTSWADLSQTYSDMKVDITINSDPGANSYFYYANNVDFSSYQGKNSGGAYAGFQTNGHNGSVWVGKMAIFSVWDVQEGIAEPNGWGVHFAGEGTGYSVRIPYDWKAGRTYRLRIFLEPNQSGANRWWGATLTDLSTNLTQRIGRISVPTARGYITNPVTFHERFSGPSSSCTDLEHSEVTFTNMTGDTKSSHKWSNYYQISTLECDNYRWAQNISNGVRSVVGVDQDLKPPPRANIKTNPQTKLFEDPKPNLVTPKSATARRHLGATETISLTITAFVMIIAFREELTAALMFVKNFAIKTKL